MNELKIKESKLNLEPIPQIIKNEVEITKIKHEDNLYKVEFKYKGSEGDSKTVEMEECDFILMDKFIKFKKKLSDRDFVEFYNATVDFLERK